MAKTPQGEAVFNAFFSGVYPERWPKLYQALKSESCKVARVNQFTTPPEDFPGLGPPLQDVPGTFLIEEAFDLERSGSPLLPFYRMDPASIIAARQLQVRSGDRVLDLCAAPGGKSLILLEALFLADLAGQFVANELSAKRRFRMMTVFKRYLPKEVRSRIEIKGWDGSLFGRRQPESYDKVLLDAPCSGERGVVSKASDMAQWKEKRSKSFAIRQYALLASAFDSLRPGGQLLYSTCSISPHENDGVIQKLKKKKEGQFEVDLGLMAEGYEPTEWGYQALPDFHSGWGPLYFCRLNKL